MVTANENPIRGCVPSDSSRVAYNSTTLWTHGYIIRAVSTHFRAVYTVTVAIYIGLYETSDNRYKFQNSWRVTQCFVERVILIKTVNSLLKFQPNIPEPQ